MSILLSDKPLLKLQNDMINQIVSYLPKHPMQICCFIIYVIWGSVDPSQENIDHSRLVVSCLNQIRLDFQGAEKRSLLPYEWIL